MSTQLVFAVISNNCSIPGAAEAPISFHRSEQEARASLRPGEWVEEMPLNPGAYRVEEGGAWTLPRLVYPYSLEQGGRRFVASSSFDGDQFFVPDSDWGRDFHERPDWALDPRDIAGDYPYEGVIAKDSGGDPLSPAQLWAAIG